MLVVESHRFLGTCLTCLPCALSSFRIRTFVALGWLCSRLTVMVCCSVLWVSCHIVRVRVMHGSHRWLVVWVVQVMHLSGVVGSMLVRCVVVKRRMLVHEGSLMSRWPVEVGCHVDGL